MKKRRLKRRIAALERKVRALESQQVVHIPHVVVDGGAPLPDRAAKWPERPQVWLWESPWETNAAEITISGAPYTVSA